MRRKLNCFNNLLEALRLIEESRLDEYNTDTNPRHKRGNQEDEEEDEVKEHEEDEEEEEGEEEEGDCREM